MVVVNMIHFELLLVLFLGDNHAYWERIRGRRKFHKI